MNDLDRLPTPQSSVFDDVGEWVAYLLYGVDEALHSPTVWLDADYEEIDGLLEELKQWIMLLPEMEAEPAMIVDTVIDTQINVPDGNQFIAMQTVTVLDGGSVVVDGEKYVLSL